MDSDNFAAPDGSATHFRGNSQNRRQRSTAAAAVDHHHNNDKNDNEHDDRNGRPRPTRQQNHRPYQQQHQPSGAFITRTAAPTAAVGSRDAALPSAQANAALVGSLWAASSNPPVLDAGSSKMIDEYDDDEETKRKMARDVMRYLPHQFQPGEWDVICQRGKQNFNHIGNMKLRLLADRHLQQYKLAKCKKQKSIVVTAIIETVRDQAKQIGGCGFVRKDLLRRQWFEVTEKIAREKIGQSLRDALNHQEQQKKLNHRHSSSVRNAKNATTNLDHHNFNRIAAASATGASPQPPPAPDPLLLCALGAMGGGSFLGGFHHNPLAQFDAMSTASHEITQNDSTAGGRGLGGGAGSETAAASPPPPTSPAIAVLNGASNDRSFQFTAPAPRTTNSTSQENSSAIMAARMRSSTMVTGVHPDDVGMIMSGGSSEHGVPALRATLALNMLFPSSNTNTVNAASNSAPEVPDNSNNFSSSSLNQFMNSQAQLARNNVVNACDKESARNHTTQSSSTPSSAPSPNEKMISFPSFTGLFSGGMFDSAPTDNAGSSNQELASYPHEDGERAASSNSQYGQRQTNLQSEQQQEAQRRSSSTRTTTPHHVLNDQMDHGAASFSSSPPAAEDIMIAHDHEPHPSSFLANQELPRPKRTRSHSADAIMVVVPQTSDAPASSLLEKSSAATSSQLAPSQDDLTLLGVRNNSSMLLANMSASGTNPQSARRNYGWTETDFEPNPIFPKRRSREAAQSSRKRRVRGLGDGHKEVLSARKKKNDAAEKKADRHGKS
eukprot:CAMPEP_0119546310 /NCGR_PEP_ID=MMETSP1352-20130426/787_1 /TAXON_ID=265584 /ORGANISM="Stauroneis constricta, Strain CCMP1120" /LENGTH=778 /DNA_ID=CAMNT_0007591003 /DNA_START=98 /DNA_END=2434 /DNA_ORIENTATION=-